MPSPWHVAANGLMQAIAAAVIIRFFGVTWAVVYFAFLLGCLSELHHRAKP